MRLKFFSVLELKMCYRLRQCFTEVLEIKIVFMQIEKHFK